MKLLATIRNQRVRGRSALLLICIFYFVFMGLLVIPYPGVETDEALFASGIFAPTSMADHFELSGRPVVIMLMSYLGGLKAWIYTPILALAEASPWSLRFPGRPQLGRAG